MARKFLFVVALIIVLIIAGAIALAIWSREATEIAFVPRGEFVEQEALAANAYEDPTMWYSRPGIGTSDPSRYQPAIAQPAPDPAEQTPSPDNPAVEQSLDAPGTLDTAGSVAGEAAEPAATPDFAVFFVPPTSYTRGALGEWNAPLNDEETDRLARVFLRGLASPFNRADEIWAPKYRQAAVGAFLTDKEEASMAIDAAYADVAQAFDYFLASVDEDKPIVLAGHSQGSVHILRLLREKVAGQPVERRIAAVYAPGWPISVAHDLPAYPFPACATSGQPQCIVSFLSYTDDGDPGQLLKRYSALPGIDGEPRGEDDAIVCTNPLTGMNGGSAPASANLGTLKPREDLASAELIEGAIPARCDARGILRIGDPPDLGPGVLPGGNYHVYDIPLFWKNLQEDVLARVQAWTERTAS
ncbi:DUF3089 domain-containing protein [Erythrobacter sp. SD-21]|uniref:DUF3089 domain-containing protein n=1 Tax=Erythrobacter sp. SD-21 TaxID=161528 RepID=UPI000153F3AD|nr:DUF3089 domain-containing protein [Erythrobacter sp. SD-21]EDL48991.1 hypothetical protein ED21_24711 [Erythrobacter sp. SD-21]